MRKMCIMFAVLATMSLAGCGEGLYVDSAFVGTWHWVSNVEWSYVFNEDGTGQRGDEQRVQSFSWGTRDGVLILDHGQGFRDDELTYTFSGNMLNLTGQIGNFDYFRFVPDLDLVGTWVIFADDFIEITKYADGTGFWMPFLGEPNERIDFDWYVAGGLLIQLIGPGMQVEWTYSVSGDVLSLIDTSGEAQEFTRGQLYQNPALIGTWAWDEDDSWEYFFGENAGGMRGKEGYETQIIWTTINDTLIIINLDTSIVEQWSFAISSGNVLRLDDLLNPGIGFVYALIE